MTTTIFTECLRALDAFCQQDMSLLQNIKYMHYPPLFLSWGLDMTSCWERCLLHFVWICRQQTLHTWRFQQRWILWCLLERQQQWGGKKKDCDLEPVTGFAKICTAYKTVKLFFSVHSIAMCYEQNIVSLELVLFGLKCKVLM
jgi:hypothetical protein